MILTKAKQKLAFILLAVTFIYLTVFSLLRDPVHNTISMTGLEYPVGFALLCILLFTTFLSNFAVMFYHHGYTNVLVRCMAAFGSFCIVITAFFPTSKEGEGLKYFVHGTAAILFFALTMLSMLLFLFSKRQEGGVYRILLGGLILTAAAFGIITFLLFIVWRQRYGRAHV